MTTARPLRRPPRPEDERAETGRGLWVSAGVHGALVALVIFGGPLFQADEAQAVRIADVDETSPRARSKMPRPRERTRRPEA